MDFIWSGWPPLHATWLALEHWGSLGSVPLRGWLLLGLVWAWGLRLTANFVWRGGIGHEDWRYTDQRAQYGRHFWWASIVTVFLAQSSFMFCGCLSFYPAIRGGELRSVHTYSLY